jgi:hypothetical protein
MALNTKVQSFDPKDVDLIIAGYEIEEYGSDSMVTVTPNEDRAAYQEGINGGGTVNHSRKLSGTLSVTVPAASKADAFFDQLQQLKKAYPIVLRVPDQNKVILAEAWYQSQPDLAVGSQVDDRTHVLGISNSSFGLIDNAQSAVGQVETLFNG